MNPALGLVNTALRLIEKPHMARATPDALRRSFEIKARLFFRPPRGARICETSLAGRPALRIDPPGGAPQGRLLYFHGGGYVFGSPRTHAAIVAHLCTFAGIAAVLPDYRKAPEHPFPAAIDDALAAWQVFAADGEAGAGARAAFLGGDSAGGGLALALLGEICRQGLARPAGVFAFSPLTDVTFSGASFTANRQSEVLLPAERVEEFLSLVLGDADPRDPRISPLFAEFSGAPPVWIGAGSGELLRDDTTRMAARLRSFNAPVVEVIAPGLPHVWPFFHNLLPQARTTLAEVAGFLKTVGAMAAAQAATRAVSSASR